jgi:hypothetical protein
MKFSAISMLAASAAAQDLFLGKDEFTPKYTF